MSKVNALDEENVSVPGHEEIIARLKIVSGEASDAGLSKWLGKTATFIATCKNRKGISLDVVIPKLSDDQLLYVLRGKTLSEKSADLPALNLEAARITLGMPLEVISPQVDATPQQVGRWVAGKGSPTARQLALLFNLIAIAGVAARCSGHAVPAPNPERGSEAAA